MLKHSVLLVLLSVAAVFFKDQLAAVLHGLLVLHNKVATWLAMIFSHDPAGQVLLSLLALILIPLAAGGIVCLILVFAKKHVHPHTMSAVWFVWTVLLVTMLAQTA